MSHKNYFAAALILFSLSACISGGFTQNKNSFIGRVVSEEKLANGKSLMVGYKDPAAEAECLRVNKTEESWTTAQMKGTLKLGGGRSVLTENALAYANSHPESKINYVFLDIPNEVEAGPVSGIPLGSAYVNYYSCKNPPAKHSNPFKD
ncbi:MAG: hypothetical protein K0R63_1298 [Rickettsiales bacterium]|nr:hypothetical protein [Rickettsiales bacterium]